MNSQLKISTPRSIKTGSPPAGFCLLAYLCLALLLTSCATSTLRTPEPPALEHDGPVVKIADHDLLAVTPRMEEFLEHYVLGYENLDVKRQLLSLALTNRAMLGFHYDDQRTLTAQEAFETRSGNCIAFANLFIAMAREAGLDAKYHEVLIPPEWSAQDDTFIISKHINVVVKGQNGSWEMDISGREIKLNAKRRIMEDREAYVMYLNNLGVNALLEDDLPTAYAYLAKAIDVAPKVTDSWSNIGVVLSRNGQLRDAEFAYKTALQMNPNELTAMGNLYDLYLTEENLTAAEQLATRVERYRKENPYYLLLLSDEATQRQDFKESLDLLKQAIRRNNTDHRLHFAMARTQYLSGRIDDAENSLSRARELASPDEADIYERPLSELVEANAFSALQ